MCSKDLDNLVYGLFKKPGRYTTTLPLEAHVELKEIQRIGLRVLSHWAPSTTSYPLKLRR
jgi:hypothetical protein